MPVCQNLHFNMPRPENQLFQIHLPVAEAGHSLSPGAFKRLRQLLRAVHPADSPAAAAGRGFQENRITHRLGHSPGRFHAFHRSLGAGRHRNSRLLHPRLGRRLTSRPPYGVSGGADKGQAPLGAGIGKFCVFRQKSIARMYPIAARGLGHREQGLLIQVAVRRFGRTDADGLGSQLHRQRLLIGLGIDRDGLHPQLPAGPEDAEGNFAPVGDQNPPQHAR